MKKKFLFMAIFFLGFLAMAFQTSETKTVKCMVQMTNYTGEGAYIAISLINPNGQYEKTVQMLGDDPEWYGELKQWWNFKKNNKVNIDAITGETLNGGARTVKIFKLQQSKIDHGYKLRFETAVENQKYFVDDLEMELTTKNLQQQHEGKGYIRYVRFITQ